METPLSQAMKVVIEAIKTDPAYRESWIANIAMAMKDEYNVHYNWSDERIDIHKIANDAAKRFLDSLTGESKDSFFIMNIDTNQSNINKSND